MRREEEKTKSTVVANETTVEKKEKKKKQTKRNKGHVRNEQNVRFKSEWSFLPRLHRVFFAKG